MSLSQLASQKTKLVAEARAIINELKPFEVASPERSTPTASGPAPQRLSVLDALIDQVGKSR